MSRLKAETLSIRTTTKVKQPLRSVASMVEIRVLKYARQYGLPAQAVLPSVAQEAVSR